MDEFEYRPLEDSPKAVFILVVGFFVTLQALFVGLAVYTPDPPVHPWWGVLIADAVAFLGAASVRAAFPWRAARKDWWVPFAAIAALVAFKIVFRSLLDAGVVGAYVLVALMGGLTGYLVGFGIARARLLGFGPVPPPPPRFVWQLRTPKPAWRRTNGEPPDPPYRGY